VYETQAVLGFFPLRPVTIGHTLLIPKRHIVDFLALEDPNLAADLGLAAVRVGRSLERVLHPDGMNVVTSAGAAATQTVFHLHLHIVPRRYGDAIGNIWPSSPAISEKVLDGIAERVRYECTP
jgi:histidine triad (HIT) family protein